MESPVPCSRFSLVAGLFTGSAFTCGVGFREIRVFDGTLNNILVLNFLSV